MAAVYSSSSQKPLKIFHAPVPLHTTRGSVGTQHQGAHPAHQRHMHHSLFTLSFFGMLRSTHTECARCFTVACYVATLVRTRMIVRSDSRWAYYCVKLRAHELHIYDVQNSQLRVAVGC